MEEQEQSVSVVIPTRNRPRMVVDAVRSALAEPILEVSVIVDGPEDGESTSAALSVIDDPRLRVMVLEQSVGGSEARNLGARSSMGNWIGFLDDDDLWLPGKIAAQLALAATANARFPVLSCAVLARGPSSDRVWPRRLYRWPEPMSEYLFCRAGWTYGAGLLQTSTLLLPRELILRVPFTRGLKKHQDWDWLLRIAAEPDVNIAMAAEPLVIFHVEGERASVGRAADWEFSYRWVCQNRAYFTPRAFASFVATECAPQAARGGASAKERWQLFRSLFTGGAPSPKTLLFCAGFLLVPQALRRNLRDALRSARGTLKPAKP